MRTASDAWKSPNSTTTGPRWPGWSASSNRNMTSIGSWPACMSSDPRLRQAIGVLVRLIMERRGWQKTGRKGSLGVHAAGADRTPAHNSGGLAFWFVRAERYERPDGMPFRSVRARCEELESASSHVSGNGKRRRRRSAER